MSDMGQIEITDGTTNRRQEIRELSGDIRIDVSDIASPTVFVPESMTVKRTSPPSKVLLSE